MPYILEIISLHLINISAVLKEEQTNEMHKLIFH